MVKIKPPFGPVSTQTPAEVTAKKINVINISQIRYFYKSKLGAYFG